MEAVRNAFGFNVDPVSTTLDERRLNNQLALAEGEKPPHQYPPRFSRPSDSQDPLWMPKPVQRREESAIRMGKHEYAQWLNNIVYPKFQKGQLVTLRSEAFVPNVPPRIWFQITEIQEIHYMANLDRETREPKAIGISLRSAFQGHSIPVWYPPALLRRLQPEEEKAVDDFLRDKAAKEAEAGTTNPDPADGS